MRKIYWIVTPLVFCLGVALGVFGYMFWQANYQQGINPPDKTNASKVSRISPFFPNLLGGGQNQAQVSDQPQGQTGDQAQAQGSDQTPAQGGDQTSGPEQPQNPNATDPTAAKIALDPTEQEKLISDYKQAIGILFDAWKERDPSAFRSKLTGAYTGEILENHVRKAEKYLINGVGISVNEITFDHVAIESADKYAATVNAIYRYTSQDYDLEKKVAYGDSVSHFVHVRANLVKIDSKWMITAESSL